jgi:hypothetical protein
LARSLSESGSALRYFAGYWMANTAGLPTIIVGIKIPATTTTNSILAGGGA